MKKEKHKKEKRNESGKEVNKLIIFPRIIFSIFILIVVFLLPLILISSSKSFYLHQLEKNNCAQMISEKDCKDLSMNALEYLKGNAVLDDRYSAQEKDHFADVKNILDFAKQLIFILLIFVIIYFMLFYFLDASEIFRTLRLAGWMSIGLLFLLLILITTSFSGSFLFFHAVLFPQGNWTFPFDSTIITVFSENFFVHAAFTSFILSFGMGLMILGSSFLQKNNLCCKNRNK